MKHFDYFVIGAGSGGVRSARIAANHGAKVGIAEKSALGGTCVNVGCVPKKLFTYASDYGPALKDMKTYGWTHENASFNWSKLIENKNAEILKLNGIYENLLGNANVDVFRGHAKFIDSNTIDIDGEQIQANNILIATGGTPKRPDFPGAEYAITSDEAFFLEDFPNHVVIQGGGYIAVEFAHIFVGLGAKVTVLYRKDLWLSSFDHEISEFLKNEYIKQGVNLRFGADIEKITSENDQYTVHTTKDEAIPCDLVLSAIGRVPNIHNLGLDNIGITTAPNGRIEVDHNWQTSIPHIYAVGDVSSAWHLTPYAIAEGHILADRLYGSSISRDVNFDLIPTAIFSNPPISTIGPSEEELKSRGTPYKVYKTDFRSMRYAFSNRDERTFMKLLVHKDTDQVLSCHMVGVDTPEMLQGIAVAMNAGATKADFDRTLPIHPTSAEELVTMK